MREVTVTRPDGEVGAQAETTIAVKMAVAVFHVEVRRSDGSDTRRITGDSRRARGHGGDFRQSPSSTSDWDSERRGHIAFDDRPELASRNPGELRALTKSIDRVNGLDRLGWRFRRPTTREEQFVDDVHACGAEQGLKELPRAMDESGGVGKDSTVLLKQDEGLFHPRGANTAEDDRKVGE